jgi:ATPase family associated with various cellular activities (AAA)
MMTETLNWFEYNQQYLSAELERLRSRLEQQVNGKTNASSAKNDSVPEVGDISVSAPPTLLSLCAAFGLSPFERDILLFCAGIELDSRFQKLCTSVHGDPSKLFPTFSLALATLPEPHWSAITPAGPLRYWRLIEVGTGSAITQSPLRIDERILHYLTGTPHLDERLVGYMRPLPLDEKIVPSHKAIAKQIAMSWSQSYARNQLPMIQLCGNEVATKRSIAGLACAQLGMNLNLLSAQALPSHVSESESLRRLCERETVLNVSALYLDCDDLDMESGSESLVRHWIETVNCPLIVSSREPRSIGLKDSIRFKVAKPTTEEQRELWQIVLGPGANQLNGRVEALVSHFNLDTHTIHQTATQVLQSEPATSDELGQLLWQACGAQSAPRLGELAQRIEPKARWIDLVLPDIQLQTLQDIARHLRHRLKVYETWGFADKSSRGLGISALFVGVSGTGKTMAAEVLANELSLELYRVDLSQVVSKYIGETEKNLRRVFDAAEESSAILLFDEADALFGKRSEVKDSHDRYANVEISYLLQRMEAYRGLAILTTNMKEALDQAFLRRIRFVVQFPFPNTTQRLEIWRRIFPGLTPTEGLNLSRLSKLNVTGGNIHNIALYAAFLAADSDEPVHMDHLLRAVRVEFAKLEKPLTEAEMGDWA